MKDRRARVRAGEKRLVALVFFSFLILSVGGFLFLTYQSQNPVTTSSSQPRAAIVDQLSLTCPNQTFVDAAVDMLKQAGYTVDYFPGEKATVDCYRNLPALGYKIIILRVHCGHWPERQAISFFTSETYSESEYAFDQLAGYLHRDFFVYPPPDGEAGYFSITPLFVKDSMKGKFNETAVIMMGCYGLEYPGMAEAFIEKGAKAYISWNGSVAADHTDQATMDLLKHLILEKQTIGQAVENTVKEVGVDPTYESALAYYPSEAGNQTIRDVKGDQ
jgi:hypothetical protein